ncbi:MAG: phosphoribosylglycinamide formyltransferase [Treponema sp.]|jgi:phosphoribosylglycinamide formyltransferase-1|nr:phosphoribosylglycinamide formyltransferase [Treponema sp.]
MNILILVSGNGSNLQALIDAERSAGLGRGKIAGVIADRGEAFALKRAQAAGIPCFTEAPRPDLPKEERRRDLSNRILRRALEMDAELIILAGFLSILEGDIIETFRGRIINLHPSLLPKFGGPGMYGEKVHRAVLDAGEKESGCTVHFVDAGTDTGPVILKRKVPVMPGDSPSSLAERIHKEEHTAIVEAAVLLIKKLST